MFRPPQLCAVWGRVALAATLLVAVPGVARAQFERASVSGTVTDQQGGVVPGVTVTAVQVTTQQSRTAVTDASGFYTHPVADARQVRHLGRARRIQEDHPRGGPARRRRQRRPRVHARARRADRSGHRHVRCAAAPDRRHRPQDRRSQGPRAALVLRPQSRSASRRSRPAWSAATSTTWASPRSATAASTSTAAAPKRTTSRSTAPSPSAPGRPARSSASRTSTRCRKSRC